MRCLSGLLIVWALGLVGCANAHRITGVDEDGNTAESDADAQDGQRDEATDADGSDEAPGRDQVSGSDSNDGDDAAGGADTPIHDTGMDADWRVEELPEIERALTYYADVKPIIDARCTTCHYDGGIGPMPLTSYDEVTLFLNLVGNSVEFGIMPPWTADAPLDFFAGDRRLTTEQKAIVVEWVAQGGPEGDPDDEPNSSLKRPARELARVDLSLELPVAYEPQIQPDDYRCFVLDWPLEDTRYITGLSIEPDNTEMVHHAIVYHVQPEAAEAARARDAEEEGPGYTCFGGSGADAAWLQSYEPGGYAQAIPGELGFEVRPGSAMVLQIHYNTLHGLSKDRSRVDFTLEDEVDRIGDVTIFAQPLWYAGAMPIPAGEPDVVHSYRGRGGLAADRRYEIFWVDLHMHALGSRGRIGILRAGAPNRVEPLLVIPDWDFAWQETYILNESVILEPGDQLYLECHWDNTADNQIVVNGERLVPRDVNWGDGTTDEMCLGNVLTTPL